MASLTRKQSMPTLKFKTLRSNSFDSTSSSVPEGSINSTKPTLKPKPTRSNSFDSASILVPEESLGSIKPTLKPKPTRSNSFDSTSILVPRESLSSNDPTPKLKTLRSNSLDSVSILVPERNLSPIKSILKPKTARSNSFDSACSTISGGSLNSTLISKDLNSDQCLKNKVQFEPKVKLHTYKNDVRKPLICHQSVTIESDLDFPVKEALKSITKRRPSISEWLKKVVKGDLNECDNPYVPKKRETL